MSNECSICFNTFKSITQLLCNCTFYTKCIDVWIKKKETCPICQFEFSKEEVEIMLNQIHEMKQLKTKRKNTEEHKIRESLDLSSKTIDKEKNLELSILMENIKKKKESQSKKYKFELEEIVKEEKIIKTKKQNISRKYKLEFDEIAKEEKNIKDKIIKESEEKKNKLLKENKSRLESIEKRYFDI
ncbi:1465_t:CDS:1 [Scutellospora calospora]|uniref:1465_t:CDS:1 n=1 Tax=Scutellospora calospora TaxID=85575 RepID=A0ACA9P685_9GLOM|nr:1465_t:CDS:1 [Scutellospora calospora]